MAEAVKKERKVDPIKAAASILSQKVERVHNINRKIARLERDLASARKQVPARAQELLDARAALAKATEPVATADLPTP